MKQSGVASAVLSTKRQEKLSARTVRTVYTKNEVPASSFFVGGALARDKKKINQHGKIEQIHQAFRHYVQKQVLLFFGQCPFLMTK